MDGVFTDMGFGECGFLPMITGERRANRLNNQPPLPLSDLIEPMHWVAERWPGALDFGRDAEEVFQIQRRSGPAAMTDWLALMQNLQHSDDHHNQVATVLSPHGIEAPELDMSSFAEAGGVDQAEPVAAP